MTQDEIIEMAIENTINGLNFNQEGLVRFANLVAVKERETLAQEQEPVAWWNDTGTHIDLNVSSRGTPLYTTPPQRTWVDLTDEEIKGVRHSFAVGSIDDLHSFARAILNKSKEKNNEFSRNNSQIHQRCNKGKNHT